MNRGYKKKILMANHGSGRLPGIRPRLKKLGWKIITSHNIIDTLAMIRDKEPRIILLRPSSEPIPEFEIHALAPHIQKEQKILFLLKKAPDLQRVATNGAAFDDFIIGSSPAELLARIHLAQREADAALERIEWMQTLEEQSITDYKTGLYNDRFIFRRLTEEFQRSTRHGLELSIIMMDLDNFKSLNDNQGHPFGDFILQAFAKQLTAIIRNIDIPGRYGGDEFLVLLPNTGQEEARMIAERIRSFLESYTFVKDENKVRITLSQGINSYMGEKDLTCDQFLKGADRAVLEAKRQGKNQICNYSRISAR